MKVAIERFPIAGTFTISRGSKTEAAVVTVSLQDGALLGRGECVPYARYGETLESVAAIIDSLRSEIERGLSRDVLSQLMPAGAARNAVDCALWDLEAKRSGQPVHILAGLDVPQPVTTAYTISLGSEQEMAASAAKESHRALLKIKLGAPEGDEGRIRAVRQAAPNSRLIADANEGWTAENLEQHFAACRDNDYALIEQPVPASQDEILRGKPRPVPVCADESVHDRASLDRLVGLYDLINVKLDKTGGLTEALLLSQAAREKGFGIMVGCMVGSSLAMAPALLLAQGAEFVDLDGPLLLARDRENSLVYEGSTVFPPAPSLWG